MPASTKKRLPLIELLQKREHCRSEAEAGELIRAKLIEVNGAIALNERTEVSADAIIRIRRESERVGRGGEKLAGALDSFGFSVSGAAAADLGSSTGGFTEELLLQGARKVFAVDSAVGELAWKLRSDERVAVMEGTNVVYLKSLPEPVQVVTVDISLISLSLILPVIDRVLSPSGHALCLFKPQYELSAKGVFEGGVISDPSLEREALRSFFRDIPPTALCLKGIARSRVSGRKGNQEYFLLFQKRG